MINALIGIPLGLLWLLAVWTWMGWVAGKRIHFEHNRTRQSPDGRHAQTLGLRIGYWPCLSGPYISVEIGSHRLDLWYGTASYKAKPYRWADASEFDA